MKEKPYALSVKVVVTNLEGRCLLLKRSSASRFNAGKWDFPGGKMDHGESIDEALLREAQEETGLVIRIKGVLGAAESESPAKMIAYLIFEASTDSVDVTLSDEHDEFCWVSKHDLPSMDICTQFLPFVGSIKVQRQPRMNTDKH